LNDGGVNGGVKSNEGGVNGGVNLEELILELIVQQPGIKAPAIAEELQKSLRTTQRYLKMLSDGGRIEFRGAPKNGGYYQIADNG
jgi:predicted transcriptional regulator